MGYLVTLAERRHADLTASFLKVNQVKRTRGVRAASTPVHYEQTVRERVWVPGSSVTRELIRHTGRVSQILIATSSTARERERERRLGVYTEAPGFRPGPRVIHRVLTLIP